MLKNRFEGYFEETKNKKMNKFKNNLKRITLIVIILMIFLIYPLSYRFNTETLTIQIEEKESIRNGESNKYIIFSSYEVFENTDSFLFFKFNSSDYQNKLKKGKTYKVKVTGWRIPFISSYRNIVKIIE